jgi:IS30 family transposase
MTRRLGKAVATHAFGGWCNNLAYRGLPAFALLSMAGSEGTEFHGYKEIERATGVKFYFARPYHSWERGTSESTNGLIRQYLPMRKCMASLTQSQCDNIAHKLNTRPRERHDFRTPIEVCQGLPSVALQM